MHILDQQVSALLRRVGQEIILPHFRNLGVGDVLEKSPGELVTVADRLSETALTEGLLQILPEATVVGEEACEDQPELPNALKDRLCWIIDPIDGTTNFSQGKIPFGILVALCDANETLAGWLYDPMTSRLCHAVKGSGAWIDQTRVTTAEMPEPSRPVAAISKVFMNQKQRNAMSAKAGTHYEIVDIPRCAAEQYPRIVLGHNHVSIFERTLPWDHAAGILFLNEAGGIAARWDGTAYCPADTGTGLLAASTPKLWEDAARRLG